MNINALNTVTLPHDEWIEIRAALIHTSAFDRKDGREEDADLLMAIRQKIVSQMGE